MHSLKMLSICLLIIVTFLFFICVHGTDLKHFRVESVSERSYEKKKTWVVLVAGSNGWYNYRHQSDICHAYHVVQNHGILEENIITMMYDDIAHNKKNPYPGKIFNVPNGRNVYEGVKIDYSGIHVTPENFLAVLSGNETAVKGGSGKVVKSTRDDHIFVYFTDHGAVGLVSFPNSVLTVKNLNDALKRMHKLKKFARLVFYMEACESGSMFAKVLPKNIDVYAVTASNSHESSWGCFCDNEMKLPCLGDCFSVNWIINSETVDLNHETLTSQFQIVKQETNMSHVMHYGDLKIAKDYVAYYLGDKITNVKNIDNNLTEIKSKTSVSWPSREIYLRMLEKELYEAETELQRSALQHKIEKLAMISKYFETFMKSLIWMIVPNQSQYYFIIHSAPSAIESLNCFDDVIKAFHQLCFHFSHNPYVLKYTHYFSRHQMIHIIARINCFVFKLKF
ncbi:Peptidase C13 family protein [Acanthocheilonema viteae]